MFFNVFHNHFIGDVPRTCNEISSPPEMTPPKGTAQSSELRQHFSRCFTFYGLNQLTHRNMWRYRDENVNMVSGYMPFDYFNIFGFAYLLNQVSRSFCNFTSQDRLAIFRYPHDMILNIVYSMTRSSIISHIASLLKSSPKGEGFSPIPRRGH